MKIRFFLMFALMTCASQSFAREIYLDQNGSDENNGATREAPIATLSRAIDLAKLGFRAGENAITIKVNSGIYIGQTVVLDEGVLIGKLSIVGGAQNPSEFPIFSGAGSKETWLKLRLDHGKNSGLTVERIQIQDYFTAISIDGNRDDPNRNNSGTIIRHNIFKNIGSIATPDKKTRSTAVIRLVNSSGNTIENNFFHKIRNWDGCGALHSIYAAHFSSVNKIMNNTFDDVCGSAIKLRDRSNFNHIEGNRFSRLENVPAIEEWFCDMQARKDCTKKLGECPSTGNVQRNNFLNNSGKAEMVSVLGNSKKRAWCSAEDFSRDRIIK